MTGARSPGRNGKVGGKSGGKTGSMSGGKADKAATDGPGNGPATGDQPFAPNDAEAFARNLARAVEEGGRALAAYLKGRESGTSPSESIAESATDVFKTIAEVGEYWSSDPARLVEAQTRLWGNYLDIWSRSLHRATGQPAAADPDTSAADPDTSADKRFADPQWTDNPMFDALKQLYLATSGWARELVEKAEGLDPDTRQKARFYIEQINNALSPTNFPFTNPEVLRETATSNAENLVRGMRMLAEDIEAGKGTLKIRQSDPTAFNVGENLATTPGKVVAQNDICQLIQYKASTDKVLKRPLLIVPPWINKFYILDLNPEKSFVRWAVGQGHTVFVVSWVNPDRKQADMGFEAYMRDGILSSLDTIEKITGADEVNAIGYCVGGTLLAITLAWMAATSDRRIASATLLTAQVDFTHAGDLKVFADRGQIEATERRMRETGYLEGTQMATAFNLLRSNDLIWPYVVNNYLKGKEPFPFDLLYWNSDATRMPSANHSYYLRNCYLENNLARGLLEIAGVPIDLGRITVPVYNLATREDHIAPAKSVFAGSSCFGGPVTFVLTGSGHIAGVVNPPARTKYQHWTGPKPTGELDDWLAKADEHPGSWWPNWQTWIEARDNRRVAKRRLGGGKLKPIEDAPGSYVMVRA